MSVKDFFNKVDQAKFKDALSSDDPNELRDVAEGAGFDLTLEQLDYVAGGVMYDFDSDTSD